MTRAIAIVALAEARRDLDAAIRAYQLEDDYTGIELTRSAAKLTIQAIRLAEPTSMAM